MKPIGTLFYTQVYFQRQWLGFIYGCGIQGLACHIVVYRYEAITKYEELLDERRFKFLLPYHFKNYDTSPPHGFDEIFSYYQSRNICEREGFARI
jgi:hypothetical protein